MRVRAIQKFSRLKAANEFEEIGFILREDGSCVLTFRFRHEVTMSPKVLGFFELSNFRWDPELGGRAVSFRAFRSWVREHSDLIKKTVEKGLAQRGLEQDDPGFDPLWSYGLDEAAALFGGM